MKDRTIKVRGVIEVRVRGPDGKLKFYDRFENMIMYIGFNNIVNGITGGGIIPLSHLGIGWGAGANTPESPSQTDLQGANKNRTPDAPGCVVTKIDSWNWKLEATWGANNPSPTVTVGIEEIGTFWGASGANMFSRAIRPIINKAPADSVEIIYNFSIG